MIVPYNLHLPPLLTSGSSHTDPFLNWSPYLSNTVECNHRLFSHSDKPGHWRGCGLHAAIHSYSTGFIQVLKYGGCMWSCVARGKEVGRSEGGRE